jgi:hypothetical protein
MRLTPELRTKRDTGYAAFAAARPAVLSDAEEVWRAAYASALAAVGWRWGTEPEGVFPVHAFRRLLMEYRITPNDVTAVHLQAQLEGLARTHKAHVKIDARRPRQYGGSGGPRTLRLRNGSGGGGDGDDK